MKTAVVDNTTDVWRPVAREPLVSPNETTRGHVSKLFVRQSRVDVRNYFFGNRVVKIWNSLPATVEDFASIRKFKSFIERVNLSQYENF